MVSNATVTELDSVSSESEVVIPKIELVSPPAAEAPKESRPRRAREGGYDPQLEWLIRFADADLGARGTLAGVVSQIERGSVGGTGNLDENGCFKHPYTDLQLGQGVSGIGDVEKHRHLMAAWRQVPAHIQNRLCLRYSAPRAQYRADEGFGAKDKYVQGSDARVGQHQPTRTGVYDMLKEYAGLAFELCADPALLFLACIEPRPVRKGKINQAETKRRSAAVTEALGRARVVDSADHEVWFAAKRTVPALRSFKERTGRDRCHLTTGVQQVGRAARSGRAMRTGDAAFAEDMRRGLAAAQAAE